LCTYLTSILYLCKLISGNTSTTQTLTWEIKMVYTWSTQLARTRVFTLYNNLKEQNALANMTILGMPAVADFKAILWMNLINNNLVTMWDIRRAENIFSPDTVTLKSKIAQKRLSLSFKTTSKSQRANDYITRDCVMFLC
jgi:hypothetical protein